MMYPIRDPREYQTERLREARRQHLISLALSGRQRPQLWPWSSNKQKEIYLSYLKYKMDQMSRAIAHHLIG